MASRPSDQGWRGPPSGVDHVLDVGVTPLPVVGVAEGPAVAGRAAEVDVEEREAGVDEQELERRERAVRLPGRAAMRVEDRRDAAAGALAGRTGRSPQAALDAEPVASGELDPFPGGAGRGQPRRRTAGANSVTWRGRAPSGATPGTGSSQRSWGRVSRSPIAASQAPSASQPTARQTPSHGEILVPAGGGHGSGRLRWPAAAALGRRAPATSRTTRSIRPSRTSTCTKRVPSGDGSGTFRASLLAGRLAVLALAIGQDEPVPPVGERRTTWNQPSASVTYQREPSAPQRAGVVAALAGDDLDGAGRDVDERDLGRSRGRPAAGR